MYLVLVLLVITESLAAVQPGILEIMLPGLHRCRKSSSNISECIGMSIESIKPHLESGVDSLNIPPFREYYISQFQFASEDTSRSIALLTDISVRGITNYKITRIKVNEEATEVKLEVKFPFVQLYSIIDMLQTPYSTLPGCKTLMNFQNIYADITIRGNYSAICTPAEYFQVTYVQTHLYFENLHIAMNHDNIHLDLQTAYNIATDLKRLATERKNQIQLFVSSLISSISNNIFSKFPRSVIFPG